MNTKQILEYHAAEIHKASDADQERTEVARRCKQTITGWCARKQQLKELELDCRPEGPKSYQTWLRQERMTATKDRRKLEDCPSIIDGIATWKLDWLKGRAVVCYERAKARLENERTKKGLRADEAFMQGVVKEHELNTALANPSDHYVIISANGAEAFASIQFVAAAQGMPRASVPVGLLDRTIMSARQAATALGNGVHTGVMRAILRPLIDSGKMPQNPTYGSAFAGVDLIAVAMELELHDKWEYKFASESQTHLRGALLATWRKRGLTKEWCIDDARHCDATTKAPRVDVWSMTGSCKAYSSANRGRDDDSIELGLIDMYWAMDYVRKHKPRVVLIENVAAEIVVKALQSMMGAMQEYEWQSGVLDPRNVVNAPVARTRFFGVGVLGDDKACTAPPKPETEKRHRSAPTVVVTLVFSLLLLCTGHSQGRGTPKRARSVHFTSCPSAPASRVGSLGDRFAHRPPTHSHGRTSTL